MTTEKKGNSAVAEAAVAEPAARIVEVQFTNPKRTGKLTIRSIINPHTGKKMPLEDEMGQETTMVLEKAVTRFNTGIRQHRQALEILDVHPHYTLCAKPLIRIRDIEQDAQETLEKEDAIFDAKLILRNLSSIQRADFARIFLGSTDTVSEVVMKARLNDIANNDPQRIKDEWENPNREVRELLAKAKERKVVETKSGIYYYGQRPMGDSFEKAMLWLKENEDLVPLIKKATDKVR